MARMIVVIGYETKAKANEDTIITTLSGDKLKVEKSVLGRTERHPAGSDGAYRYFFDPDAELFLSVSAKQVFGAPFPGPMPGPGSGTTFKYADDGGSVPKSFDDGYGPPKDPTSDKSPIDDKAPGDDVPNYRRR